MIDFTCPEHVFAHFGQQISRKRHRDWRMTEQVSMRHKCLPWEGKLVCTDGIEAVLIDFINNNFYLVMLLNLDDASKALFKTSIAKQCGDKPSCASSRSSKISSAQLNNLLAQYDL